jgi:polysaccharide biosynthesis/export protein
VKGENEMLRNCIVAVALIALAMPAYARQVDGHAGTNSTASQSSAPGLHTPATQDPSYVIGADDVLDIDVWKENEITRSVEVRPDGKISLPLLNDVQASGLTPTELAANISKRLKQFVADPEVTVIVTRINSQRVYILGEATRPGAYPLLPGMTVLEALSSAGGFTIFANTKKIYVLRNIGGKVEKFPFNYKDVIKGKHAEQDIQLKAGDQIVVP